MSERMDTIRQINGGNFGLTLGPGLKDVVFWNSEQPEHAIPHSVVEREKLLSLTVRKDGLPVQRFQLVATAAPEPARAEPQKGGK